MCKSSNTPNDSHVLVTRWRWSLWCAPLLVVAIVVGSLATFLTQEWHYVLLAPGVVSCAWLLLILNTPQAGLRIRTYSRAVHIWAGSMLALVMLLVGMDVWILGHGIGEPAEPYHAIAFVGVLTIMVISAGFVFSGRKTNGKR